MAKSADTVRAKVIRGSYWTRDADNNPREVLPGKGKDSEVEVTPRQLEAMKGVLAPLDKVAEAEEEAAAEAMAPVTTTEEATSTPPRKR